MAAPVISTILKTKGTTIGGDLVEIYGLNFQDYPISTTLPTKILYEPVGVWFGTKPAAEITVVEGTRLILKTPYHKENVVNGVLTPVDITISNLDSNGDPIPGETTVATEAFTFQLPSLQKVSRIEYIIDTLITLFKDTVHPNIVFNRVHTDYDDTVSDRLNITKIASLPHAIMIGPQALENRFYSRYGSIAGCPSASGEVEIIKQKKAMDLTFRLRLVSDSSQELLRLKQAFIDFFERTKYFNIPTEHTDPTGPCESYELDIFPGGDFTITHTSNNSNIIQAEGGFMLTGVHISSTELVEKVGVVDTFDVGTCPLTEVD